MKETFEQHIQQALSEFTQHREALARVRGKWHPCRRRCGPRTAPWR